MIRGNILVASANVLKMLAGANNQIVVLVSMELFSLYFRNVCHAICKMLGQLMAQQYTAKQSVLVLKEHNGLFIWRFVLASVQTTLTVLNALLVRNQMNKRLIRLDFILMGNALALITRSGIQG